jgi:hypothetical protein
MNSMSDRFERESERAGEGRSSTSMMHLLGQMLMLPFTVFVYGMDMFVKTIKGMQKVADQGMEVMAGEHVPRHDLSNDEGCVTDHTAEGISSLSPQQGGRDDLNVSTTTSASESIGDAGASLKETVQMIDRNLSDDQLKLVRFKILFVKRDYEAAFREQEALVPDNMTGEAFTAWKVAEFIQELGKGRTPAPAEWPRGDGGKPKYPKEPTDALAQGTGDQSNVWYLKSFPEKDKKYLRVYYEVLDRYVREEEDDEVVVLKEIRDAIHAIPKDSGVTSP